VECKHRCVNFRRVSDPGRAFLPTIRVTGSTGDKPGSADDKPGSADDKPGSTDDKPGSADDKPGSTDDKPGSADDKPGSADDKPGSADDKPGSTRARRRHVWEHLESQSCIQFVFSSMYLGIDIATLLHTLCLC